MEFYGNEVKINENYNLVGMDEIVKSSIETPVLVTRDIQTCLVILAIYENEAKMLHVNLIDEENYKNALSKIKEMMTSSLDEIKEINLFVGLETPKDKVSEICGFLNTKNVYKSYIDCYMGSIGYNFKTKEYYGLDNDGIFHEYILGMENKKVDPLESMNEDFSL